MFKTYVWVRVMYEKTFPIKKKYMYIYYEPLPSVLQTHL